MREIFEDIYARNAWGRGSGVGSLPIHTRGYIRVLERFLQEHRIRTVVDLGCGDWQFSRLISWRDVIYTGYDLVRPIIERNTAEFSAEGITFHVFSGDFNDLPSADLLIAKDVLQHWSNESIVAFLPTLKKYKYSLITNCVNSSGPTTNVDIQNGKFRPLDLRLPPFKVAAEEIYSFSNYRPLWRRLFERPRWTKKVLLLKSEQVLSLKCAGY
jgi:SAM-dependent methyltransferase